MRIVLLVLSPLVIFYLLFLWGFFTVKRKLLSGRWILFIACIWLLIITTDFIPGVLTRRLEKKYYQYQVHAHDKHPGKINIVVLGAGHSDDPAMSPNNQLSLRVLGRLVEGVRIYKEFAANQGEKHNVQLVVSGAPGKLKISQAEVLKSTAIMLGVDSTEIGILNTTTNTRTESEEYVRNYGTEMPIILVTDAIHMSRALTIFTSAGVVAKPAPANFVFKNSSGESPLNWIPSADNISRLETALHEYAGILWHKAGGR